MEIILDNHQFTLIHRTNKKIKRVSLALENKDEIIVKTPLKFKSHMVKEVVFEHKDWILRTINKVPAKNSFDFVSGGVIPYLGKDIKMVLVEDEMMKHVKFSLENDTFVVKYNKTNQTYDQFVEGLKKFYKYNATKVIDPIFDEWTFKTKLLPKNISYRFNKGRWGSCSYENNISINYKLLQFDKKCIEYVVLHELCHIKEKNHSSKFWNLVSLYMPEYKEVEKMLRGKLF